MTEDWIDEARRRLLDLRRGPGAWGYRPRSTPAVEPSALAALALLASDGEGRSLSLSLPLPPGEGRGEGLRRSSGLLPSPSPGPRTVRRSLTPGPSPGGRGEADRNASPSTIEGEERRSHRQEPSINPEAQAAARWLASIRQPDGSLGVTVDLPEPGWTTPYALLLWAAVGGFEADRSAARGWLLGLRGQTSPRIKDDPMGHDASIVGWPWVAGTHSWVEPTALAMLALGRVGRADHPRAVEGARLLVDRAIPGGGWNLGNPVVFGTPLRPLPGPSGMALLALAMVAGRTVSPSSTRGEGFGKPRSFLDGEVASDPANPSKVVAPAIAYLRKALAETLAPASLGWGLLGLRAWGAEPAESSGWLASSFERVASREPRSVELALLLLAAGPRSPGLLGISTRAEATRHV